MGMGTVNEVFADERKLNISHGAIEALGWPEMTMDFELNDNTSLEGIEAGAKVHFTLLKDGDGNYLIDSIQLQQ